MGVVIAHKMGVAFENLRAPGVPKFNMMNLLHAEEHCEFFRPI